MNKWTKISFNVFKVSSFVFVLLFLIVVILNFASGHRGDFSISFILVFSYSLSVYLIIDKCQKIIISGKDVSLLLKLIFALLVFPAIILSIFCIIVIVKDWLELYLIMLPVLVGLLSIVYFGFVILKCVIFHNS